jgi:UDPglucose 6-dehydrogenase
VVITVVGSGYVGLVAGACFAELGHEVISVDNDELKIARLQAGQVPIHEKHLPELLAKHHRTRIRFSSDLVAAVHASQAIFIAVGTPSTEEGTADLSYVEAVARTIAVAIDGYKVIVEKSTVPVLTSSWIRKVMMLNGVPADKFDVVSNPEFLREGSAVQDFLYPDRIVIGADSERSAGLLRQIYEPLTSGSYHQNTSLVPAPADARVPAPLIVTSARSAELIKHASNAFLATKISFINAVANICEAVGADVQEVCQGIGADARIGGKFLNPGIGYGGSCFPKDLKAFASVAKESGYDFQLLEEVKKINERQRQLFLRKVRSALWTLKGKRVAVLGLAFKGGTDDVRESPALEIVKALLKEGCAIRAYDPAAMKQASAVLPEAQIAYSESAYDAASQADALLILTDWPEFATLDLGRLRTLLAYPIVVDGRNLYDPATMRDRGFIYYSVGRTGAYPVVSNANADLVAEYALPEAKGRTRQAMKVDQAHAASR